MGNVANVTADRFDAEVIASPRPVLVDFWAEWCKPCVALSPVLDQLAPDYAGKVDFVKINVQPDAENALADSFGVKGIPALIIFKDGKETARILGSQTPAQLSAFIDANV